MANQELTFGDNEFIVSKTDLKGHITYGNKLFITMSGYSEKELLGAPHNILRHADMPKSIFKLLWDDIQSGKEIFAYVKNHTKNSDYYWVFAHVTPSYNGSGHLIGFHSVRRNPMKQALNVIEPLYKKLIDAEKREGIVSALKILKEHLAEKGVDYDEFILSI